MPGPPPVMTVKPSSASRAPSRLAAAYEGSSVPVRADPKTRHRGAESGQGIEAVDELADDAQGAPGVRLEERRVGVRDGLEELAILGPPVALGWAVGHQRSIAGRRTSGRQLEGGPSVGDRD